MSAPSDPNDVIFLERLQHMGEAHVRLLLNQNAYPLGHYHTLVIQWLAKRDKEAASAADALRAEQLDIDRSAKDAAWEAAKAASRAADAAVRAAAAAERDNLIAKRANVIATIALSISIIVAISTAISIRLVHIDAKRAITAASRH